ncbi:Hypothetical protein CINCED_3A016812, partial [Cinara cedri]
MDRTPSSCCSQPASTYNNYGAADATIGGYPSSYNGHAPLTSSSSSSSAAATTATTVIGVGMSADDGQGCFCCDSDDDSVERARVAHAKRKCYKSCLRNAFVCALLVSYTFAGALIFLSIEGDVDAADLDDEGGGGGNSLGGSGGPVRLAGLMPAQPQNLTVASRAAAAAIDESRARTVETIWEITVNLNILYRENWTRLASQELNRFQEDLIRRLMQQMEIESAAVSYHTGGSSVSFDHDGGDSVDGPFEWNMATSFLYCLSILTTIAYSSIYNLMFFSSKFFVMKSVYEIVFSRREKNIFHSYFFIRRASSLSYNWVSQIPHESKLQTTPHQSNAKKKRPTVESRYTSYKTKSARDKRHYTFCNNSCRRIIHYCRFPAGTRTVTRSFTRKRIVSPGIIPCKRVAAADTVFSISEIIFEYTEATTEYNKDKLREIHIAKNKKNFFDLAFLCIS